MPKTRKIDLGNPFDSIAVTNAPAKSTSNRPVANVPDDIKILVDKVLAHKKEISRLEAEQKDFEEQIIATVQPQQDSDAYAGKYSNSYDVPGIEKKLAYITTDKFSVDQDEATHIALKQLLGTSYDKIFSKKRTITLVEGIDQNQDLITNLLKAIKDAGLTLAEVFVVEDKIRPIKELAEKQYTYVKSKDMPQWRALCRQNKASLKSTSNKK